MICVGGFSSIRLSRCEAVGSVAPVYRNTDGPEQEQDRDDKDPQVDGVNCRTKFCDHRGMWERE